MVPPGTSRRRGQGFPLLSGECLWEQQDPRQPGSGGRIFKPARQNIWLNFLMGRLEHGHDLDD